MSHKVWGCRCQYLKISNISKKWVKQISLWCSCTAVSLGASPELFLLKQPFKSTLLHLICKETFSRRHHDEHRMTASSELCLYFSTTMRHNQSYGVWCTISKDYSWKRRNLDAWMCVLSIWAAYLLFVISLFIILFYANFDVVQGPRDEMLLTECDKKWGGCCCLTLHPRWLVYVEMFQCCQHRSCLKRQTRLSTRWQMVQIVPKPQLQIQSCQTAQNDSELVRLFKSQMLQDTRFKSGMEDWIWLEESAQRWSGPTNLAIFMCQSSSHTGVVSMVY